MKMRGSSTGNPNRHTPTLGVTLDFDAVRIVYLRRGRIARWLTQPYPEDLHPGAAGFAEFLKETLAPFRDHLHTPQCWALAPLPSLQVRYLKIPKAQLSQRSALVYWTFRKECPFDTHTHLFDYAEEGIINDHGEKQILVTAYTVAFADIEHFSSLFKQAHFPLDGLVIPHFAIRNLHQMGWLDHEAFALTLYVGDEASAVQIHADQKVMYSRMFKTGLQSLLSEGRGAHPEYSDQRLLAHLRAPIVESDDTERRMQPALDRLVQQIERTQGAYQSMFENTGEVQSFHVMGEPAAWPRLMAMLRESMAIPIDAMDVFHESRLPRQTPAPENPCERALYAMAAATALSASRQTPNLLDTHINQELEIRRHHHRLGWVAALLLSVGGVAGIYYGLQEWALRLQEPIRQIAMQLAEYEPAVTREQVDARLQELNQEHERLSRLAKDCRPAALIYELAALTPQEIRLLSLQMQLHPHWMAPPTRSSPPERVVMEGRISGEEVPIDDPQSDLVAFVMALDDHPLFDSVSILQSALDADGSMRFEIMARPGAAGRDI